METSIPNFNNFSQQYSNNSSPANTRSTFKKLPPNSKQDSRPLIFSELEKKQLYHATAIEFNSSCEIDHEIEITYYDGLVTIYTLFIPTHLRTCIPLISEDGSQRTEGFFEGCTKCVSIKLPESIIILEHHCFYFCQSLFNIHLPPTISSFGEYCFSHCKLRSIIIPSKLTSIGDYCFDECNFLQCELPSGLTIIGKYCFTHCQGLEDIVIPSQVTRLEISTFSYCSRLEKVQLHEQVGFIGNHCFLNCKSLKSVNIPKNIVFETRNVFRGCPNLEFLPSPCCNIL